MSAALAQFHFLRPWCLLALAALPWLLWQAVRRARGTQALLRLVDANLLPSLLQGQEARRGVSLSVLALAWVIAVLALAGPSWNRAEQPLYARRAAQVVAISLSQRMLSHDVAPSRIDLARHKAHALFRANRDGLNALIGYAGEAFVVAPLTSDIDSLGTLLDAIAPDTMPVDGDNAAAAIRRAAKLLHDANTDGGSLVLITDSAGKPALAAARAARAAGVRVSVLGVGTPQGAPVPLPGGGFLHDGQGHLQLAGRDDAALAALAAAGGGRYVVMTASDADVQALQGELRAAAAHKVSGRQGDDWQDRGPWLLLLLLPLAALAFRRGWLLLLPLVLLPLLPVPAHASGWRDWWQRPDQQAAAALRRGDARQAMQLARDPAWRGAAAYRAGDYAAAAQALRQAHGSDASYNLGNALARAGKYEDAIHAYDEALRQDAANADAKANRQAVEDWLRKQHQPPPKSSPKPSSSSSSQQGKSSPSPGQGKHDKGGDDKGKQAAQPAQGKPAAGKPGQDDKPAQPQKTQPGDAAKPASAATASAPPKPLTPQQQAAQQAQAAKAQQALRQQLDRELGKQAPATHQLGAAAGDDAKAKLPADIRRALQRVPDDPGALLRRKFELEYQRRHGGVVDGENP